jgi:putative cell wall-binding protein
VGSSWWNLADVSSDEGLKYFKRIDGTDRYATMKKIVKASYNYSGDLWWNASVAVIASGENFPDALAANGLAGALNGGAGAPVILTKKNTLSSDAKTLLKNLQVQTVYIMGGTSAISAETEQAIKDMKIATIRVAGADRQATSVAAFKLIDGNWFKFKGTHSVIIATGANYADALSIAPFAYKTGTPIILTKADGTLTDEAIKAIKDNDEIYQVIVVGGTNAVSDSVFGAIGTYNGSYKDYYNKVYIPIRIAGADRYDTSAKVADWEINYAFDNIDKTWGLAGFSMDEVFVATGENFPDALAGGQLAGGKWYASADYNTAKLAVTRINGDKWYDEYAWRGIKTSSSPILLTKDGDRSADYAIAKHLNWNTDTMAVDAYDFMYGLDLFFAMYESGRFDPDIYDEGLLGFFLNGTIGLDSTGAVVTTDTNASIERAFGAALFTDGVRAKDNNFVGYILGGKAAVSKAKAEQLDDTVDDTIYKYYDSYAANDNERIVIDGRVYYTSLGYLRNLYRNVGNVYGVDTTSFAGVVIPIWKDYGPFDTFYALIDESVDASLDTVYTFAEFKRNGLYDNVNNQYTGYDLNGMVTATDDGTDITWARVW